QGYVPLYANALSSDLKALIARYPLAIPGYTSGDLLTTLHTSALVQLFTASSDVITWNIGGEDLSQARSSYKNKTCGGSDNQDCLRNAVKDFKDNWNGIIAAIFFLRRQHLTIIRTMDIYNPFVAEDKLTDT